MLDVTIDVKAVDGGYAEVICVDGGEDYLSSIKTFKIEGEDFDSITDKDIYYLMGFKSALNLLERNYNNLYLLDITFKIESKTFIDTMDGMGYTAYIERWVKDIGIDSWRLECDGEYYY